jgi:hypothetical protein
MTWTCSLGASSRYSRCIVSLGPPEPPPLSARCRTDMLSRASSRASPESPRALTLAAAFSAASRGKEAWQTDSVPRRASSCCFR